MSAKPKKGGAKGKKGKKVKKGEKGEHELEERYKKTLHEITSLRVELGERTATLTLQPGRRGVTIPPASWCRSWAQHSSRSVTAYSVGVYRCWCS